MKKTVAFIILIVLIVVVGTIYYQNSSDVGVKIDRLKLKHAITSNSTPESLMSFSNELGAIKTEAGLESNLVSFEKNYWGSVSLNKKGANFLTRREGLFGIECGKDQDFDSVVAAMNNSKTYLDSATALYSEVRDEYTVKDQEDWDLRLKSLDSSILVNSNLLFTICPIN